MTALVRAVLALTVVLRAERVARLPVFAVVPHGAILGECGRWPVRWVNCGTCGNKIRAGDRVEVRRRGPGQWEHVACPVKARLPRGGRGIEEALRASVR